MDHASHNKIVSFIWSIADDCLRDVFVRGKYRDVILPMFVLRRIDCLLEDTKEEVLAEVKFQQNEVGMTILADARRKAYTPTNSVMVEAYWKVGQQIVEEQQQGKTKAGYGEAILQNLSRALTEEFGKGFSYANLRNFRPFYLTFPDFQQCYTLCSELSWSHYRLIMRG